MGSRKEVSGPGTCTSVRRCQVPARAPSRSCFAVTTFDLILACQGGNSNVVVLTDYIRIRAQIILERYVLWAAWPSNGCQKTHSCIYATHYDASLKSNNSFNEFQPTMVPLSYLRSGIFQSKKSFWLQTSAGNMSIYIHTHKYSHTHAYIYTHWKPPSIIRQQPMHTHKHTYTSHTRIIYTHIKVYM